MKKKHPWIFNLLLIVVLAAAAFLRLDGADWGELQHQHPDELFLSGVVGNLRAHECVDPEISIDICPPEQQKWIGLNDYFDTKTSTLNPHNRGFAFFVYGTLPLFIVRYSAELTGNIDFGALKLLGRQFSAFADLGTILLLYLIVARLYNRKTALLAAAFSAFSVMQIQQSHFFTTDLFVNLFSFLAIYFAVEILVSKSGIENWESNADETDDSQIANRESRITGAFSQLFRSSFFWLSIAFGLAYGMALASKVNIFPLAILLPGAFALRTWINREDHSGDYWKHILIFLIAGGLAAFISFRIFQPYAFDGILPNEQWLANIAEQRVQARGDADLPWNLQWARRTHLYSFKNLTIWGLGLPLGILAWAGFLYMGWRIIKGERRHLLLWGWTAAYFLWQSLQFNPTMRYQLPIYPLLAMMAAWVIIQFSDSNQKITDHRRLTAYRLRSVIATLIGILVLLATAAWAFAFQSIYTRPEPRIAASRWIYQNLPGPINLRIQQTDGTTYSQPLPFFSGSTIQPEQPYLTSFRAKASGQLSEIYLPHIADTSASGAQTINLLLSETPDALPEQALGSATLTADFYPKQDIRGQAFTFTLDSPVLVIAEQTYYVRLETGGGTLTLTGASVANETDYDYGLPFRVDGYDGFGGIYSGDTLQVYWDDNAEKLARFSSILNASDYIFIPTNHQYGQITRLPERYPLTTKYYRELMGCPAEITVIDCYREAQPGMYAGNLGFELVAVFESYPQLGPVVINDQSAEEAFTFYDHPKVLIFKKRADYDPAQALDILSTVDLNQVVHLTPRQAGSYEHKDLMLPPDRLAAQRAGGTWSELFDYDWPQNKYPWLGLLLWYAFIFALGVFTYPLVRLVLPGLAGKGYPLARTLGLVLLAYVPWLLGSLNIAPYSRTTIGLVFASIAVAGLTLGWMRKDELAAEWKSNRKFFLIVEMLFLAFFIFDLLIRIGNPDLWHPSKGGERPMDFSYFNAVLKSTSFPPFDPWFSGGYINYYYYGFVLVGTPVKLLGIVPAIAYNFILPTLFATVAVSAFTVGWGLVESDKWKEDNHSLLSTFHSLPFVGGLAAALMMVMLGNLGTVRMVYQAWQRMAAPGGIIDGAHIFQRWWWAVQGFWKSLSGTPLPLGRGDWYWHPSRVIPPGPGNEITEFPFFTFLYSDLHAHMIVLPLTLFMVAWALSTVKHRKTSIIAIIFGALVLGAIRPVNTWDVYTYIPLAAIALAYAIWRHADVSKINLSLPEWARRVGLVLAAIIGLMVLQSLFYKPFTDWFSQAYNSAIFWDASHTPLSSYLTHWGLFLFLLTAWMAWETRNWMAVTPVSALEKLKPYQLLIEFTLVVFLVALLYMAYLGAWTAWLSLPLALWAGILILRPGQSGAKRAMLFFTGTGLALTLAVEIFAVQGDIGRMNTIFKLYLQAWTLFSVSAAAAFGWVLVDMHAWRPRWRNLWQALVLILFTGAALFTVTATIDKISDRLNPEAPHSLDSMEFMAHSELWDGEVMDLSQDYRAIRWLQDNVQGSPVIVEAHVTEYRWGTRYTIYTGLPGVVGWNWHQRQQRALMPHMVTERVDAVNNFYNTTDIAAAHDFLKKYAVQYIIVGQFERILYPEGLAKFETYDGIAWKTVYKDGQTVIYETLP
ncbi:MAG: hypothetical protein Kow002_01720 [Anaerolineales bacterium]